MPPPKKHSISLATMNNNGNNNNNKNDDHSNVQVLAVGDVAMLFRNCADCGVKTGRFCDTCLAKNRFPNEEWAPGQMTPLCELCDKERNACHFCWGKSWAVPPPSGPDRPLES